MHDTIGSVAPISANDELHAVASAPFERRALTAAAALAGPLPGASGLQFGLRALSGIWRRAGARQQPGPLKQTLERDADACRRLILMIDLAGATARELGVEFGAGALFVARSLEDEAANDLLTPAYREALRDGARGAHALVRHCAAEQAAGRAL